MVFDRQRPGLHGCRCVCLSVVVELRCGCRLHSRMCVSRLTCPALAHVSERGKSSQSTPQTGRAASSSSDSGSGSGSTLQDLRVATGLGAIQPRTVFAALRKYAKHGSLTREMFTR